MVNTSVVVVLASVVVALSAGELNLMLLHTNDMHARFVETDAHSGQCHAQGSCYGGFARVKGEVDRYRQEARREGRSSLFLNAGDTYQGSAMFTFLKWRVVSELLNMMDIDVMSLGNHEFDNGPEGLAPFLTHSTVPIVCCNIDFSEDPVLRDPANRTSLTPSKVLDVGGVKVGVIGYLTPETKFLSSVGGVNLLDEVVEIRKEARRLTQEGVKVLIAVGHSGYSRDMEIAEQVPELDVVVGGHTNTFLYNGAAPDLEKPEGAYPTVVTQPSGRKVLVVQAYAYTKYLGVLRVTFDDQGEVTESSGNPILLDHTVGKNTSMEEAVERFSREMGDSTDRKVGTSKVFLEAGLPCRLQECNFGNLVTDAIVFSNAKDYIGNGWTDAPVGLLQGGSLRASISTEHSGGVIKYGDVLLALPFLNSIERLTLKGKVLKDVLEHSVAKYSLKNRPGGFLQYSGIQVEYNLVNPPNQRVVAAMVRCANCSIPHYEPLNVAQDYVVLTTSFLADGGDGFLMLKKATKRVILSFSDVEALANYLGQMSPVIPEVSGRIKLKGVPEEKSAAAGFQASWIILLAALVTSLRV